MFSENSPKLKKHTKSKSKTLTSANGVGFCSYMIAMVFADTSESVDEVISPRFLFCLLPTDNWTAKQQEKAQSPQKDKGITKHIHYMKTKQLLLSLLMSIMSVSAFAEDAVIDGINYSLNDKTLKQRVIV